MYVCDGFEFNVERQV